MNERSKHFYMWFYPGLLTEVRNTWHPLLNAEVISLVLVPS